MTNQGISELISRKTERLLLLLIILIGIILRFWNYTNMPFMHDELSALSRLEFDSLRDVVKYGVMLGDTHPAGVQVFLYFWTMIGGTGEMWVKLPFITSGIVSIWLSYKIGKLWFNGTTGLLTATMIASTQLFVLYSQIARPYSSGLLLTLAMVYMWSLYFFKERKHQYLILYIVFSVMAAYNHYFSLLFVAIVGFSSVLFIKERKEYLTFLVAGITIFIFYIPHLNIFFTQFEKGDTVGVGGWLEKPEPVFLWDYINYMLQFSIWNWLCFGIAMVLLFIGKSRLASFDDSIKKRATLLLWFLLPIIAGYTYSIIKTPVIQYSTLLFSTPYIYMLLFSFNKNVKSVILSIAVFLLITANTFALIKERQHYDIFYRQPYDELYKTVIVDNHDFEVFVIDDCVPYYNEYYIDKYNKDVPYFTKRNSGINMAGFMEVIGGIEQDIIVTQGLSGEELAVIQNSFPHLKNLKRGFTYDIHTFSKIKPLDTSLIKFPIISTNDFSYNTNTWKYLKEWIKTDSDSSAIYQMPYGAEWGPSIVFGIEEYISGYPGIIDVKAELMFPDTLGKVLLVGRIDAGDSNLFWRSSNYLDFNPKMGHFSNVYLSIDLQAATKHCVKDDSVTMQISIWNMEKQKLNIRSIEISSRPGNPKRYGLYTKF